MKTLTRILPVLLALLACALVQAAPPGRAGMVVDVQGAGRLVVDGAPRKLELLAYVPAGARVELDAGARASISLYATRSVYQVVGPAVVEVGDAGMNSVSGAAPAARSLAQKLVASAQPGNRVHGAVRMRDVAADIALVTPENGTVLLAAPVGFHWEANVAGPYRLVLADAASPESPIASAEAGAGNWMLPADVRLVAGRTYRWSVAPAAAGDAVATASFTLADEATRDLLRSIEPAADAPIEDWVLYAAALQEHGVRDEARMAWRAIAAKRPDLGKARQLAR